MINQAESIFSSLYKQFGNNSQIIEAENICFELAGKIKILEKENASFKGRMIDLEQDVLKLAKENAELKDKVSRRNMQIKDLEKKIEKKDNALKVCLIDSKIGYFLDTNDPMAYKQIKEAVNQ